jgi:hypothetical protein
VRLSRKHPALPSADPWRFFFGNSRAKRPFVALAVGVPRLGGALAELTMWLALAADRVGLERSALMATSLIWDLEYFRGVRADVGGVSAVLRSARSYLAKIPAARRT